MRETHVFRKRDAALHVLIILMELRSFIAPQWRRADRVFSGSSSALFLCVASRCSSHVRLMWYNYSDPNDPDCSSLLTVNLITLAIANRVLAPPCRGGRFSAIAPQFARWHFLRIFAGSVRIRLSEHLEKARRH
ncbi:hypothetical protein C8R45DRAFT_1111683 [Mycena sanguinolenta]|nr:hypothetical protein C8R45DRAFT_1111683 [Mycena sanguinolenta]